MIKTISIIHKNDNGDEISNSNHIIDLLFNIKSKNLQIKDEDENSDALFVLHTFNNFQKWDELIKNRKEKSVFVFPTTLDKPNIMKNTFKDKAIAKIIVSSEFYQKYFIKTLGFSSSLVKLIQFPCKDYRPSDDDKIMTGKRVVLTPSSVRPEKDFNLLINAMSQLSKKYNNFHYIMLLTKHPSINDEEYKKLTQEMIDAISGNFKENEISFITNQKLNYVDYLSLADVILYPYDNSNKMYLNSLFDGIVAHKPIVIPETNQTKDLIKRDIGGLLYQNDNVQSIIDTCGLLLDNKDVSNILVRQNSSISDNYLYSNILPHYINIFRRLKEV